MLQISAVPDSETLDLVKKTGSTVGIVLGASEDPASYARKIDEAKKAIGAEYVSIVSEDCLWEPDGKEKMLNVIAELLKAKYENEDLANLFSGAFMRALNRARTERSSRP
jgi:microsomal dipeptidase-like Zn-dependent dipeptidase